MSEQYAIKPEVESRLKELRVAQTQLRLLKSGTVPQHLVSKKEQAKELLRHPLLEAKNFAYYLDVSAEYIRAMIRGEKPVQEWMIDIIQEVGTRLLIEQRNQIDTFICESLVCSYGPLARINQEKGWE